LLWRFIEACARASLPFEECSALLYLAVIAVLVAVAFIALAVTVRRRTQE